MNKIKLTPEQIWYTSRRKSLLKRSNLLSLHAIVGVTPIEDAAEKNTPDGYSPYRTLNGEYILMIPHVTIPKKDLVVGRTIPTGKPPARVEDKEAILNDYCIIVHDGDAYAIDIINDEIVIISLGGHTTDLPLFRTKEWLGIRPGDIENYTDGPPIATTYGIYIVNYALLATPFCMNSNDIDAFKYVNGPFSISAIERAINDNLTMKRISTVEHGRFIDHGYYLSSIGDIAGTVATWKSIVPNPEVIRKRDELYKKYADQKTDPRVMAVIENELINLDKEYMKNDPSMDFLGDAGKKFNICRKRMNISVGLVEEFGAEKGKYDYISNSLSEGWDPSTFDKLQDDSRKGFYSRTVETQVGGLDTKWMILNFQNNKITGHDCGTKRLLTITPSKYNAKSFIGAFVKTGTKHKVFEFPKFKENPRYLTDKDNITITPEGKTSYKIGDNLRSPWGSVYVIYKISQSEGDVQLNLSTTLLIDGYDVITPDNYMSYVGKTIHIRSLQYCEQQDGFCAICAYKNFTDLGMMNIGATLIDLGGVFLKLSLKSMHGTKLTTMEIDKFDDYVINR